MDASKTRRVTFSCPLRNIGLRTNVKRGVVDVRGTTMLTGVSLRAEKLHNIPKALKNPEMINKFFFDLSFFKLGLSQFPVISSNKEYTRVPRIVEMNDVNIGEGNIVVLSFMKMGDIVQDIAAPIENMWPLNFLIFLHLRS